MNISESLLADFSAMTHAEMWMTILAQIIIGIIIGMMIGASADLKDKYRKGQIDALNGRVKYEKKDNKDGELVWVEKETAKH